MWKASFYHVERYGAPNALRGDFEPLRVVLFRGAQLPVENVSWEDAVAFCRKLSDKEGRTNDAGYFRSAYRSRGVPDIRSSYLGFRLAFSSVDASSR